MLSAKKHFKTDLYRWYMYSYNRNKTNFMKFEVITVVLLQIQFF